MLERLRAFWDQGIVGKLVVISGAIVVCVAGCCVLLVAIVVLVPSQRTVSTAPTALVGEVTVPIARATEVSVFTEVPTTIILPPTIPSPMLGPTDTPGPTLAPPGYVSREMIGDGWPLTIENGILACDGSRGVGAVIFRTGGKVYAVNGIAKQRAERNGWQDIAPIWADNPSVAGLKKDIGPLIERGLMLCQ